MRQVESTQAELGGTFISEVRINPKSRDDIPVLRRNLELIWLCQKATPCYKTIADFRKDNVEALKAAQREFVSLCQGLKLFGGQLVAIDGTYLKADANASTIHTDRQLQRQLE